jgi:hypothetical protein
VCVCAQVDSGPPPAPPKPLVDLKPGLFNVCVRVCACVQGTM